MERSTWMLALSSQSEVSKKFLPLVKKESLKEIKILEAPVLQQLPNSAKMF